MVAQFEGEAIFVPQINLVDIPESENVLVPKFCRIEQVAIQDFPKFPCSKRYTVSLDIWNIMDENSKASLVLHEVIYREALGWGHENSKAERFLNSLISSEELNAFSQSEFANFILKINFQVIDLMGTLVSVSAGGTILKRDGSEFFESVRPLEVPYLNMNLYDFSFYFKDLPKARMQSIAGVKNYLGNFIKLESGDRFGITIDFKGEYRDQNVIERVSLPRGSIVHYRGWELKALSEVTFVLDEDELPIKLGGTIQVINDHINYVSPIMEMLKENGPGKTITSNGIVLVGGVKGEQKVKIPQGDLCFATHGKKRNSIWIPSRFSESGILKAGLLCPNKKISTQNGEISSDEYLFVEFNSEGKAEILESYGK